jgi:S1-C subfamily serine protease
MDIEKLTKMQIVLLTLLVSFVTSIATGIVTVTLLSQAPPALTQTINRVVERTVERVVPGEPQTASVIEKEVTVVVKEDDIITDSIERNSKSLVRISKKIVSEDGTESTALVGLGVVVSKEGIIATDRSIISSDSNYSITTADNKIFGAKITGILTDSPIALLSAILSENDASQTFSPVTLMSAGTKLKLGQTAISLSGKSRTDVSLGIISSLIEKEVLIDVPADSKTEKGKTATTTIISSIKTDINDNSVQYGSPLVDIFGDVIGLNTKDAGGVGGTASYTPSFLISSQLVELKAVPKDPGGKKEN